MMRAAGKGVRVIFTEVAMCFEGKPPFFNLWICEAQERVIAVRGKITRSLTIMLGMRMLS